MATNLWDPLPTDVKESATLDSIKQNHKYSKDGRFLSISYISVYVIL